MLRTSFGAPKFEPWAGRVTAPLAQFAVASLTFERVPISRSFAAGRLTESGNALLPGRISLNFAISRMCSEVKMIFPFPQHAWGKRPLVAPSRSHDSVQRISAAASAGSKNSISTGSPKKGVTFHLHGHVETGRHDRKRESGKRSPRQAPAPRHALHLTLTVERMSLSAQ
jgi:hypothetical protein